METKEINDNINKEVLKDNKKINKILLILIFIVATILIVSIIIFNSKPYKLFTYKNTFKTNVENDVLSNLTYKIDESFEGEFYNTLRITMKETFYELNYEEQKTIISDTTRKVKELYDEYQKKIIRETMLEGIETEDISISVLFYINEDCYECNVLWDLIKNGESYKLENYLKDKIVEKLSIDSNTELYSTLSTLDDSEIEEIFANLEEYKDSNSLLEEIKYKHQLDGEWQGGIYDYSAPGYEVKVTHNWIINGNRCYNVYDTSKVKNEYKKYYCTIENNILYIFNSEEESNDKGNASFRMEYLNEKLSYVFTPGYESNNYLKKEYTINLKKIGDNIEAPTRVIIKEPTIGMTKTEVENSTWGKPNKINKDTYAWGTTEQWCYSGYKYIYFKNGYVTSISE